MVGITYNVKKVENITPIKMTIPTVALLADPAPVAITRGTTPITVEADVIRIGLSRTLQDVILFDDTIKANILYGNALASNEEIIKACKFAAAQDFVEKLPNKYETIIGENGIKLSGGQKQRLSIARAILKNSSIILLDEATSSLDSESESVIQKAIENLTKNKTTIIIAHRLSTVMNCDKILVFENGKIIEEGKHEFLVNNSLTYKKLYEKISQSYLFNTKVRLFY